MIGNTYIHIQTVMLLNMCKSLGNALNRSHKLPYSGKFSKGLIFGNFEYHRKF